MTSSNKNVADEMNAAGVTVASSTVNNLIILIALVDSIDFPTWIFRTDIRYVISFFSYTSHLRDTFDPLILQKLMNFETLVRNLYHLQFIYLISSIYKQQILKIFDIRYS